MKKRVIAYLHTHWDREWYRTKEDFNIRLIEVVDIVLDELQSNRAPFFYLDGQVAMLLDYLKFKPEKRAVVEQLIKDKKLAIGPYFVSADSYLVNFNCMLKNLELGLKYSSNFKQKGFIGYLSDIFGISNSVFKALELNNIDKAVIWRGVNPKKINNNCNFFLDSVKTVWLAQGYYNDFFHADQPIETIANNVKSYLDKIEKVSSNLLLLAIGGDHLGMLKDANSKIKEVNKYLKDYEIILDNPFNYFKKADFKNITKEKEFLDNSNTYILGGVYSTRIYQKIQNVILENKLSRMVEPLNYFLKDKYSININYIYETLIKNHAHDGIYGCSIDDVSKYVDYRFLKVQNALDSISDKLKGNFKSKYNILGESRTKIGLFNLSNNDNLKTVKLNLPYVLENSQVIEKFKAFPKNILYDEYQVPITENITTHYTQLVEISANDRFSFNTVKILKPKKETKVSAKSIENANIKFEIKNKNLKVINKKTLETFTLKFTDIKDDGDTYNFAPVGDFKTLNLKKTKVLYDGSIESALRLYFDYFTIDLILDNHLEFLKLKATIKNKKKNHKLQMVLSLDKEINQTISQDAFGIIKRKIDPNYDMKDFMPTKRPYELKTNSYPMQNFVNANNIGVLTKGLAEYEIYKNELRICLLRATGTISNPKNKARAIPAGPDLKTPQAQCLTPYETQIGLLFGNYKDSFKQHDIFFENYETIDGSFEKEINLSFNKDLNKNSFVYGIFKNKKISYNITKDTLELI